MADAGTAEDAALPAAGIPASAIAGAAGVTRGQVHRWLDRNPAWRRPGRVSRGFRAGGPVHGGGRRRERFPRGDWRGDRRSGAALARTWIAGYHRRAADAARRLPCRDRTCFPC